MDYIQSALVEQIQLASPTNKVAATAEANAALTAKAFVTMAKRAGMDARELWDKYDLKIRQGKEMQAGALGQYAGTFARTADKLKYDQAKDMLAKGIDPQEVRKATGWFKGMDGKMRFEIDDSKASVKGINKNNEFNYFRDLFSEWVSGKSKLTVGDFLTHDGLFEAYPWIAQITVLPKDGSGASYNTKTGIISIGKDVSADDLKGTLLHEIQHAIQTEEGFARGGSPDEFAKAYNKLKEMRPRIIKMLREALDAKDMEKFRRILQEDKRVQRQLVALIGKDGLVGVDQYEQLAGEIEARDTAARANMGAQERMENPPARSEDAIVVWNGQEVMYQTVIPTGAGSQQQVQVLSDEQLAETAPEAFVVGPDGTLDFGAIDAGYAAKIRRQAGTIRLQVGEHSLRNKYGLIHIDRSHGEEIRKAGYSSIEELVSTVSRGFDEAYEVYGGRLLLTKKDASRKGVAIIELVPDKDGGSDFYTIKTAFISQLNRKVKGKLLPPRNASSDTSPDTGEGKARFPQVVGRETVSVAQSSSKHIIYQNQKNENTMYQSAAWHGSPHTFDQFTTQRIGTGEGAQAYGWGLYFSSSKKVAEWYRDTVGDKRRAIELAEYNRAKHDHWANFKEKYPEQAEQFADELYDFADRALDDSELSAELSNVFHFHENGKEQHVSGELASFIIKNYAKGPSFPNSVPLAKRLYDVTLAPDEADMLDWDKPIFKQSDKIINALVDAEYNTPDFQQFTKTNPSMGTREQLESDFRYEEKTGEEWYQALVKEKGSEEAASRYLFSIGIPGITYEGTSSGERNYVMFDDSSVQINAMYQSAKGSIHWQDGGPVISLFSGADHSTFVHEAGHLFLRMLEDLTTLENAPAQIVQDLQTVRTWGAQQDAAWNIREDGGRFIVSLGAAGMREAATYAQAEDILIQEKFAVGWERYLMEGRAPSEEMRSVFEQFATWLKDLYKTLVSLKVDLTDEVRGVMDRLLAADEEIDSRGPVEPMDAADVLTDSEQAIYAAMAEDARQTAMDRLRSRLVRQLRSEKMSEADAERKRIEELTRQEVADSPVYLAMQALDLPMTEDEQFCLDTCLDFGVRWLLTNGVWNSTTGSPIGWLLLRRGPFFYLVSL